MNLENECKRIADALEKIAQILDEASITNDTKLSQEKKKKKFWRPFSHPELEDVVKLLYTSVHTNSDTNIAKSLLEKYGAERASEIPENKRAKFMKEAKKALGPNKKYHSR